MRKVNASSSARARSGSIPATFSHSSRPATTTPYTDPKRVRSARALAVEMPGTVARSASPSVSVPACRTYTGRSRRFDALAANGQPVQPQGRVPLVVAPQERDPLVDRREAGAAHGVRVQRPAVEVGALD